MKKHIKRFIALCFCMLFVLSLSLAVPASADNGIRFGVDAEIYGILTGTCVKSTVLDYVINTTTRIDNNPDGAFLVTGIAFSYGNTTTETEYYRCCSGDDHDEEIVFFEYDYVLFQPALSYPEVVYCSHGVQGGTESERGYAYYETIFVSFP